ncbi:hypothetical protein [Lysinibacillus telephonicus]|uniref:hypothetical protein n=1 Tax=Lysinibacillus telephonicus TaxID=1714840 RepID=UPI003B9ECC4E
MLNYLRGSALFLRDFHSYLRGFIFLRGCRAFLRGLLYYLRGFALFLRDFHSYLRGFIFLRG